MNRTDFDLRDPLKPGDLMDAVRKTMRAVRALMPISTPTVVAEVQADGTRFTARAGGAAGSSIAVRRLLLITEHDYWLECDDDGTTVAVAKPDDFFSADAAGVLIQSFDYTPFGGGAPYSEPDAPSVSGITTQDAEAGFYDGYITDTDAPAFHSHKLIRLVSIDGHDIHQVITPAYRNGQSIIYAAPLAKPVTLGGDTFEYVDLNVAARRWESINYSPYAADGALYPNAPISFTRAVRTRA